MAWKSFTGGVAYIYPAAFMAVYVKGTTANKWQTLGSISNGVLNIEDNEADDALGRNYAINSVKFTAKCRMMQSSLVELELLDHLTDGTNAFLFKTSDAETVAGSTTIGWIGVTAAQVGVKARVVCDGTPEDNRYIELEWQGTIYKNDANMILLLTPTLAASDFGSTAVQTDYYTIGTYTAATDGGSPTMSQIRTCGVSTMQIDGAGLSSPDTLTPITNVKMSFEMLAAEDGFKRFLPQSVACAVEYDWMATKNSDLLLLDNASQATIKLTITMIDSVVFTLDNQVGLKTNYEISGDMDKPRVVRMTHRGRILRSSFDGVVS